MPEKTAQWWFSRFKNGNFTLTDDERSGRPVKLDDDQLNNFLHENPRQSTRKLGEQLKEQFFDRYPIIYVGFHSTLTRN